MKRTNYKNILLPQWGHVKGASSGVCLSTRKLLLSLSFLIIEMAMMIHTRNVVKTKMNKFVLLLIMVFNDWTILF